MVGEGDIGSTSIVSYSRMSFSPFPFPLLQYLRPGLGLFVDRFANMGGIDKRLFTQQLGGCRTFEDEGWAAYWRGLAQTHLEAADAELATWCEQALAEAEVAGAGPRSSRELAKVLHRRLMSLKALAPPRLVPPTTSPIRRPFLQLCRCQPPGKPWVLEEEECARLAGRAGDIR